MGHDLVDVRDVLVRELLELTLGAYQVIFRDAALALKFLELFLRMTADVPNGNPSLLTAVMDATAISLCMENDLPIIVFDFGSEGNICRAVSGEPIGTLVHGAAR